LHHTNVDAMLRSLTAKQFMEWQAAFEIESFGEARADARAASIVRALYNINRDSKKHSRPYELPVFIQDFLREMEELDAPKRRQTPEQQKQVAQAIVAAFNRGQ